MKKRPNRIRPLSTIPSLLAVVVGLLGLLASCKFIDVPESPAENPVFQMTLQGQTDIGITHWKVGDDSVVIKPRYYWTKDNYLVYNVRFERTNCKGICNESIEFHFTSSAIYKKRESYSFNRDFTTGPRRYSWDLDPFQPILVLRSNISTKSPLLRERYLVNDSVIIPWRTIRADPFRVQIHLPSPKRFTLCHEIAQAKSRKYRSRVCIPVYLRNRKFTPSRLMGNLKTQSIQFDSITLQAAIRGSKGQLQYTWFDGITTHSSIRSFSKKDLPKKRLFVKAIDSNTEDEILLELLYDNFITPLDVFAITSQQADAVQFHIDNIHPKSNPQKIQLNTIEIRYRKQAQDPTHSLCRSNSGHRLPPIIPAEDQSTQLLRPV